ncbi:MAG: 16S rRNA (uracil(1498)-N(3))-methyltransferase [Omnitrophica bacterium]|nr:16S rRNA (uracil(1498)-N(3))-methyltransferase [Candidatus Omnitrophota bacterium]
MSKFFIPPASIQGDIAMIDGKEAHHILDVMRLKAGDRIEAFDGKGTLYQGHILDTANKKVKLKIERVRKTTAVSNLKVTLIQALPKKNKIDYIIQKCTELGVDTIIPVQTARTIVKLDKQKQIARRKRWERIAREAAKQCGRTVNPRIKELTSWKDVLSRLDNFDLKLLPCLSENTQKIKDVLQAQNKVEKIALFIGPEGGFTTEEIRQAQDAGCLAVSLGVNVLKSDTASVCALAMINYELK